jgi:hypothetical protein
MKVVMKLKELATTEQLDYKRLFARLGLLQTYFALDKANTCKYWSKEDSINKINNK